MWWAGLVLVALTSSGMGYFRESAGQHSLVGSRYARVAHERLEWVADRFPGAAGRGRALIPALRPPR